jgi:hypothetical protein
MAWTQSKQDLLKNLLTERVRVEQSPEAVANWGITVGWMQILNTYVTDAIKQNVLNDLIDDKIAYLQTIQASNTSENSSLQTTIDQGLALKETV